MVCDENKLTRARPGVGRPVSEMSCVVHHVNFAGIFIPRVFPGTA